MSRPTMSTPRSDSAAIRENLADIRAKLSFHIDGTSSSSMGANNNNNYESHNNSTSGGVGGGGGSSATSRFRQRPLFTFGNNVPLSSAVHRDPLSSGNGTPRRGMSFSERPQTPTGRSPSTQASAQYLLSTQRELERVQRDKHEWERRCMELEASNAELTDELQYIQECMSNKQQQQQSSGSAYERVASEEELSITSRSNTGGNGGGVSPSPRVDTASSTLPGVTSSPQANGNAVVDGSAAAARIETLLNEIKTISNERDTLLQQHQATGAQLGVLMDEYEKEKAAKDLRVAAMQKEVDEANQSCGKALRAAEQLQARHTSEIAELEADLQDAHNEVEKLVVAAKTTTSVDSAIYEQSKKELESANAFSAQQHEELEHIRSQLAISEKMQTELSNDQKSLLGQLDVAKKLIEELSGKNKSLEDSYSVILDGGKTTQEELTIEINELKAEAAESQSTIAYLEESYANEKEARENAEITIEELKDEVAAATEKATIAATTAATAAIAQKNGDFDSSSSDGEDDDDEEMPPIDFEDLTRQLAKMTEAIEAVGDEKGSTTATSTANAADTAAISVALQAAEAAQQRLHRSSHDSQVELQAAIEDCARNLQERQRSHLDIHKENLRSREDKKKEWLARKIEDVEAAYEAKIGGLESMIAELQKELNANDNDHVDADELVEANADRQRLNLVLKSQEEEINNQQHQIKILRNTLAEHTTAAAAASQQDISLSAAKEEELQQELATLQATLEKQRSAYKALEDERLSLEQRLSEEDAERTMNSTNRDAALMSRLNDLTAEYEVVVAERDEHLVKINELEAEVKETSSALETANDKLIEVSSKKEESVTTSSPQSTATTAWPSKFIVFGAETKDQIPAKTLNDVLESGCDFTPFGFAHIYDHTCWAFDAFNLDSTGPYAPQLLMHVSTSIYRDIIDPEWSLGSPEELSELAVSMGLPTTDQFLHFLANVFNGYHGRDVCPYHSRTHAADIVQMSVMLAKNSLLPPDIKTGDDQDGEEEHALLYLWDVMSILERFSLLIAALTHDCSHPGKNNGFHNRTRDPLAIRYNGKSVLENYHATTTFTLCQDPALDITAHMTDGQRAEFYNGVTYMILGTDMALHNQHLEEFMNKAVVPLFTNKVDEENGDYVVVPPVVAMFNEATNADDRLLAMRTILHAADIGNSARPFHIARKWAVAVRDEFFAQGRAEKSMGLTPSMGCDEEIDVKAGGIGPSQIGFIDFMILPLWHVLVKRYGLEAPGREALLEEYNEEADTIFDNQQTILDDVLESSMNPFRGEDVIIEFGEEITDEVEAFAWRTHFGLQMMVDALQANRLMWLDITPKEHQKRFSLEAPDDRSEIAIAAAIKKMKVASASAAAVKPALPSSSPVPCEECETKQNALAEMQKALEEGQRDVTALLENKVILIKELSETQQDLESAVEAARKKAVEMMAAAGGGGGSSSPRGGGAGQEEQHQARVKQLKEMIMTANQKKSELEADNKELKKRIVELENNNSTSTAVGKATAAVASSPPSSLPKAAAPSSPASPPRGGGGGVGSRPTSRYGMRDGDASSSSSSSDGSSDDSDGKDGF